MALPVLLVLQAAAVGKRAGRLLLAHRHIAQGEGGVAEDHRAARAEDLHV